jgi:multidrug efflux pump subunit AcrA (membrane-fusion protein)
MRLRLDKGSHAWVLVNLPDKPMLVEGKVLYVSPAADYVGQTRRVRVEIPNPGSLPAGLQGSVRFTQPSEHWMQFLARPDPATRGTTTSQASPIEHDLVQPGYLSTEYEIDPSQFMPTEQAPQAFADPEPNAAAQERSK